MNIATSYFIWLLLTAFVVAVGVAGMFAGLPWRQIQKSCYTLLMLYVAGSITCFVWSQLPSTWATLVTFILCVYVVWQIRRHQ